MWIQLLNIVLVILFVLILYLVVKNFTFLSHSEVTEGVVVDRGAVARLGMETNQQGNLSSEARDKGQNYTVIEFSSADGEKHSIDYTNIGISIGDTFPVRYDPQNPNKAYVDKAINMWIQVILLGVVFLVLLLGRFVIV